MTRKETIAEGVTLYLGDCREILPTLAPCDHAVTDPPYRITSGGNTKTAKAWGGWIGSYGNTGDVVTCDVEWPDIMGLLYSSLAQDSDAYVMANDKNVNDAWNAAIGAGFSVHNLLVWDKVTSVQNRWYMKNCEFTLYLWKGKAATIRNPSSKQLCTVPNQIDQAHPTVKPIALMEHYIRNSSDPGQTILDPFMGVGSTGAAAVRLGRKFVGVEIEPKYFEIACQRIAKSTAQPSLFEEGGPKRQEEFEL